MAFLPFSCSQRGAHVRVQRKVQVLAHQRLPSAPTLSSSFERLAAVGERLARDGGEGRVALHQAALPGVLELLRAPQLRELRAFSGPAAIRSAPRPNARRTAFRSIEDERFAARIGRSIESPHAGPLRRALPQLSLGRPRALQHRARLLRQWAADRARFALYWEDESGATAAYSFWDIQQAANRLSNALAGARREARRPRRDHPAAAPGDRDRLHRGVPDGRHRAAAVAPLRARRARVPHGARRGARRDRRARPPSPTSGRSATG